MTRSFNLLHALLPAFEYHLVTYNGLKLYRSVDFEACFPGTRVAVLEELKEWVTNLDPLVPNVFWLTGLRQEGKSSIALTIADWAKERAILGACLFFMSGTLEVFDVFSTIVQEIASFDASIRRHIVEALERDEDLMNRDLETQFKELVAGPLRFAKLNARAPILLIIDNLVGCPSQQEETLELLKFLLIHLSGPDYSHVRILISSRPELHVSAVFRKHKGVYRILDLNEVPPLDVQQEIRRYLNEKLSEAHKKRNLSASIDWPDHHDLDSLVRSSGDLFCYAEQVVRFIDIITDFNFDGSRTSSAERLRSWFDIRLVNHGLRAFYSSLLCDTVVYNVECELIVRTLAAIVLFQEPLVLESQADLLQIDKSTLRSLLRSLHPIIICPVDSQASPRPYHPSLREFLMDRRGLHSSLRRFFVDMPKQEAYLSGRCLEIMAEGLCRNSGLDTISMDELRGNTGSTLNPVLRYACVYWGIHLSKADSKDPSLKENVEKFVRKQLLIWMEAMGLLQLAQVFGSSLEAAHEWTVDSDCAEDVQVLLREAVEFAEETQDKFAESPLHIWHSLLELPEDSLLRRTYEATAVERLRMADESNHASGFARSPRSLWSKAKKALVLNRVVAQFVDGKK
ncbi:hypothetical protein SCHPADRAFT_508961 [Schizopora paradoxa]|uniref:Nephrocystin 3-like N-terminal domain-containing protein n=1 Tax=Schizopora paradoxa TaxID=27342 RepID=A0A0H2RFJ1_9AGAM|nr:hypothetical protein SCHPADRAFT_508961 [Schizopora paradoxa]